jgi:hypothetical protein
MITHSNNLPGVVVTTVPLAPLCEGRLLGSEPVLLVLLRSKPVLLVLIGFTITAFIGVMSI